MGLVGACVRAVVLLAHGDEPVAFRVVSEGDRVGINRLDLCTDLLHLLPCRGNLDSVGIEECLVVVQDLCRLGQRHRVHQSVTELSSFIVVTFDEVGLLLCRESESLGCSVGPCLDDRAVDQVVQCGDCAGHVVEGHVVGIAVGDVRLASDEDLCADLVPDIIVRSDGFPCHMDVRIELVELDDILVEDRAEVRAHRVVELDGDIASVITGGGNLESL